MAELPTLGDVVGIALLVSGLAALQYFLERGEVKQWFDDTGIVLAGVWAVVGLVWFVVHALRVREPVLELRTFRNRNLTIAAFGLFAIGANLYGSLLVISLYLQSAGLHGTARRSVAVAFAADRVPRRRSPRCSSSVGSFR